MGDRPFPLASSGGGGDVDMGEVGAGRPAAPAGEGLAELEQALGLAAAFFEGDPAAARWAAEDDGPLAGPDQLGVPDEAELDALMGLPGPPPPLAADFGSGSGYADTADLGTGPGLSTLQNEPAGAAAPSAAAAAPAASQLAASVRDMQLEDIDSEPADAVAPGGAGWGAGLRGAAALVPGALRCSPCGGLREQG